MQDSSIQQPEYATGSPAVQSIHAVQSFSEENMIVSAAQPLLDYLMVLKHNLDLGRVLSPDVVRNDVKTLLDDVEKAILKHHRLHSRLDTVKYILTGLVDEIIIFSSWQYAGQWQVNPLEMELFGKSIAGERFFDLLEQEGYRDPELAELFYICLGVGFDRKIVREKEYKPRLYALINHRIPEDERRLAPGAEEVIVKDHSGLPPLFGILAITIILVVLALVYTITSQILWNEASEYIHNVSTILTRGG